MSLKEEIVILLKKSFPNWKSLTVKDLEEQILEKLKDKTNAEEIRTTMHEIVVDDNATVFNKG